MRVLAAENLGDLITPDASFDRVALIDLRSGGQEWTFRQLHESANAVARGLRARGYRRGARIAILAENCVEFTLAYLGIMRAGLVAVPINFKLPAESVAYVLEDCQAEAAIVDRARRHLVAAKYAVFDIDESGEGSFASLLFAGDFDAVRPRDGEIAEILYTSGSTGPPKGVPLSHDGQVWALRRYVNAQSQQQERTLVVAPTYHMNGLFFTTVALANKWLNVLMPRFDAREYLQAVARYRCTILSGIPPMFALMARERDLLTTLDLTSPHTITIGSAPLTEALIERVRAIFPQATIRNSYGSTEAGPYVFGPHPQGIERPPLSLGHPLSDVEWRLVGGATADEGALEIRTPALFKGYLNLPEATAEKLHDGWFRTGDILRRDSNDFLYFVGRVDDMFVCGGENVYPGEIEKLLERHPAVMQAAVLAVPDEIKGQIPIAFVVTAPGAKVTPDELRQFTLREGPAYSHPRAIVFVDSLPVGGSHKIDKRVLTEQALAVAAKLQR
jgi:acyl-CoA synthetase (AMP-forming)/AMP-acid ligase II